ncbi:conserved hypothetical protein [Pyrenophora tritici-repentis Pt-1C-BFP]|uniref:Rhodopsin domain-containing protein n=1 Tax=Pyrenophora tritici-repentis (strain Pt-1C-BFP) TaxID=426418 RepID=B2W932_PYRTR|nr:uncharacterized protein PTRG_06490 [Pyrenophora tritici-repentis Pt-1C-BFP]EDU49410.1 conserved hypothetical protein [Pyrenophora tritici-repentis Pt-1C-BFP]
MNIDDIVIPDPRNHPENANLPNVNQPETILGVTLAFLAIAVITLSLRIWIRIRDRLWGWDDFFVILAGIASFVGDILVCMMPEDGLGLHLWTLDPAHLIAYFKHIYSTNSAYAASTALIKLSILFQYLRLFTEAAPSGSSTQYRLARRLTWGLIAICAVWGCTFFLLALFPCRPIEKNWNPLLDGKCIGWGTKDPDKFYVAIGRMIAMSVNRAGTVPVLDMTYHTPIIYIFAVLEVNFAIITASIPIFWPVIATLASNKIFVVNEVEIHVEHVTRNDSLDSKGISLGDRKGSGASGDNKLGHLTTIADRGTRKSSEKGHHQHKTSNASTARSMGIDISGNRKPSDASSVGRTIGMDLTGRTSQESSQHLYRIPNQSGLSPAYFCYFIFLGGFEFPWFTR